jgi:hypothetical protein
MCSKLVESLNAELFQYNFLIQLSRDNHNVVSDEVPITISKDERMNSRVPIPNGTQVAFEMTDVDGVETNLLVNSAHQQQYETIHQKIHDGDPKPDIGFRQDIANEIVFSSQNFLKSIEGLEKRHNSCLVSLLFDRKPCLVDTICKNL